MPAKKRATNSSSGSSTQPPKQPRFLSLLKDPSGFRPEELTQDEDSGALEENERGLVWNTEEDREEEGEDTEQGFPAAADATVAKRKVSKRGVSGAPKKARHDERTAQQQDARKALVTVLERDSDGLDLSRSWSIVADAGASIWQTVHNNIVNHGIAQLYTPDVPIFEIDPRNLKAKAGKGRLKTRWEALKLDERTSAEPDRQYFAILTRAPLAAAPPPGAQAALGNEGTEQTVEKHVKQHLRKQLKQHVQFDLGMPSEDAEASLRFLREPGDMPTPDRRATSNSTTATKRATSGRTTRSKTVREQRFSPPPRTVTSEEDEDTPPKQHLPKAITDAASCVNFILDHPLYAEMPQLRDVLSRPMPIIEREEGDFLYLPSFLDSADDFQATKKVKSALFEGSNVEKKRQSMLVVTGTSGVGKSKTYYDIGTTSALVVIIPVFRQDLPTKPYKCLMDFIETQQEQFAAGNRRVKKLCKDRALAAYAHMLISYLEWVVQVLEATSATLRNRGQRVSEQTLLMTVLRAQDDAASEGLVTKLFEHWISGSGKITLNTAWSRLRAAQIRARRLTKKPIVFCHDEAQALLDYHLSDFFRGCYVPDAPSSRAIETKPRAGMFYALTILIRLMTNESTVTHLVCGTNLRLTAETVKRHSPAQNISKHLNLATSFNFDQINTWFKNRLTRNAQEGLVDSIVAKLLGRPLFASLFWWQLRRDTNVSQRTDPAQIVRWALERTFEKAVEKAQERVILLMQRPDTATLMLALFTSMKLGYGGLVTFKPPAEVAARTAMLEGVLNVDVTAGANGGVIDLGNEPITAQAIYTSGDNIMAQNHWQDDPIVPLLRSPWLGLSGSDGAKGEVFEELFAYHVIKTCMSSRNIDRGVELYELFKECIDEKYWPSDLNGYTVHVRYGVRCGKKLLELFDEHGEYAILHFTPTSAGCADLMFLARRPAGGYRLIIIQAKNKVASTIPDAMRSLNMGNWFPNNKGKETLGHRTFREAFLRHPEWFADPVRIVLHAKRFRAGILNQIAFLNAVVSPEQPIVLATAPPKFYNSVTAKPPSTFIQKVKPENFQTAFKPDPVKHIDGWKQIYGLQHAILDRPFPETADAIPHFTDHPSCRVAVQVPPDHVDHLLEANYSWAGSGEVEFKYLTDAIRFLGKASSVQGANPHFEP